MAARYLLNKKISRTLTSAWIETLKTEVSTSYAMRRTLTSAWIETPKARDIINFWVSHSHECVD